MHRDYNLITEFLHKVIRPLMLTSDFISNKYLLIGPQTVKALQDGIIGWPTLSLVSQCKHLSTLIKLPVSSALYMMIFYGHMHFSINGLLNFPVNDIANSKVLFKQKSKQKSFTFVVTRVAGKR